MTCINCQGENVIDRLQVDMDNLEWIDHFSCGDCFARWTDRTQFELFNVAQ